MIVQKTVDDLRVQLRLHGLRATPQRVLVLRVLEEAGEHLDVESIWLQAKASDPEINLATVYRTLSTLNEVELVNQRYFDREHKREYYSAVSQDERFFFTCRNCKTVITLRTPLLAQARRQWEQELGLVFSQGCMCFDGYCAECAPLMAVHNGANGHTNGKSS